MTSHSIQTWSRAYADAEGQASPCFAGRAEAGRNSGHRPATDVTIVDRGSGQHRLSETSEWNAKKDVSGPAAAPPLTSWAQYAQVLLLANEFLLVD